jgi:rhodanese-related sulfurtransferase
MTAAATRPRLIGPAPVAGALRAGAAVVDGRAPRAFDARHLPGAVNVPAGPGAGELAALVLSRDVPVLALAARADEAVEVETGAVLLIDVREAAGRRRGYVPGSVHLPLAALRSAAHLLPDVPTVACCSDGRGAAVAASALRRWGHRNVWRVADGGVADLLGRPIDLDLLGAA